MKKIFAVFTLLIAAASISLAVPVCNLDHPCSTPEIDPGMAGSSLAMISGVLLVARGRRKRQ